jgi:uncharacterized protein
MNNVDQLFQAIMNGDANQISSLLTQDPTLANSRTPSGVAVVLFSLYYGQPALAKLFLEHGAVVDIFSAAALGLMARLKELLTRQPELANAEASDGFSPLGLASFFGQEEAVLMLLKNGAQVNRASNNSQKVMPLHSAAAGQHLAIARALLGAGAEVNARQEGGFTPLMSAAQNAQVEMVRLLLEHGADRAIMSDDGKTALAYAGEVGNPVLLGLLQAA